MSSPRALSVPSFVPQMQSMRRFVGAVALSGLVLVPNAGSAEWRAIPSTATSPGGLLYLDRTTMKMGGATRIVWLLFNTPQEAARRTVGSSKSLLEFDCARSAVRLLEFITYTGAMAAGNVLVRSLAPTEWESISPDSSLGPALELVWLRRPSDAAPTLSKCWPAAPSAVLATFDWNFTRKTRGVCVQTRRALTRTGPRKSGPSSSGAGRDK